MEKQEMHALPAHTLTRSPILAPSAWVAPGAMVLGEVHLGDQASVWYGCVVRGDLNHVVIGARTNIQDGSILHVENARPCLVGEGVVVGHHVNLHACTIEDDVLIGIGAIVLSGAIVRQGSVVAAGALVLEGQEIPPGSLAVGVPARVVRQLPPETVDKHRALCAKYCALAALHREKRPWLPPA